MTTYYISGPMRGKPLHNAEQFNAVEAALDKYLRNSDEYGTILNPSLNFGGDQTLEPNEYMKVDLSQVLVSDVIVLLPGWTESEGARREVQLALWTGKRFMQTAPYSDGWTFSEIDLTGLEAEQSPRGAVLDEAKGLITGDRNNSYGPPTGDFRRSANAANAYGYRGPEGRALEPHDIAVLISLVKFSRITWQPAKRDNWVDVAGYAGCGYECVVEEEKERLAALEDIEQAKAEFKKAVSGNWAGGWEDYGDWSDGQ